MILQPQQTSLPGEEKRRDRSKGVAIQLLAGQIVVAVFALGINVFAARSMGPQGRGELALLLQISYVVTAFGLAGADRAYPAAVRTTTDLYTAAYDLARLLAIPLMAATFAAVIIGIVLSPAHSGAIGAVGLATLSVG